MTVPAHVTDGHVDDVVEAEPEPQGAPAPEPEPVFDQDVADEIAARAYELDGEPTGDEPEVTAEEWRRRAELAEQVLDAVGIQRDDQGNVTNVAEWVDQIEAANNRERDDLIRGVGFEPDSAEGMHIAKLIETGDLAANADAIGAFAVGHKWKPNQVTMEMYYSWTEAETVAGQNRMDRLHAATVSEGASYADPELAAITEARDRGDYVTASRLQQQYERKHSRRR